MGFGKNLKEALSDKGKTVSWLAKESGVAPTTLYSLIKNDTNPTTSTLVKINSVLSMIDVTATELLDFEDYDTNIYGKNIKAARRKRNITQQDLAKMLGIPLKVVRDWETGKQTPAFGYVKKISDAIGVAPVEWMGLDIISPLELNTAATLTVKGQSRLLKNDEKEILTNFNRLNDAGRREANNQIKNLTEIPRFQLSEDFGEAVDDEPKEK